MGIDYIIFHQINGLAGKFICLDVIGIFFASYFQYVLCGALAIFLLAKVRQEKIKNAKMIILAFLAALVARYGVTAALHHTMMRLRPFVDGGAMQLIAYSGAKSSFPSGHATFFFALATVVYLYYKLVYPERRRGMIFWFFYGSAFLISLARVYVGVHYPSDILAGALIGILVGWLTVKAYKFYQNKKAR